MLDQLPFHRFWGTSVNHIVDHDHVQITRKHQSLRTAILDGLGMDRIIACSKELIATTIAHFESEESVMDASPRGFSSHKRLHAEMLESLKDISSDLEQRRIHGAMELMKFFEGRLTYHLNVEDAQLEEELK